MIYHRLLAGVLVAVVASAGCTTTGAPPPSTPTPAAATDSASIPNVEAARWSPTRAGGSWRYQLLSTGTVSLAGDSSADSLPLGRTVVYSIALTPTTATGDDDAAFQFNGAVDSVSVTIPERIPVPTAGSNSKPHFQGTLAADGHLLSITSNATSPCTDAVDPLSAASTLLFATLPKGISPGTRWTDTVSTTTCRGRLPIVTTATRHYEAIADSSWQGRPAILVARTDSLSIASRSPSSAAESAIGSIADSTGMGATGRGGGTFTLLLDPASGILLESTGTTHTEILVTMGSARFPFQEEAHQTISLLNQGDD